MGWLKDGAALIIVGGWDAKDPVLERCKLEDPRGWSCLHLVDGSQGGRVVGNGMPRSYPPHDSRLMNSLCMCRGRAIWTASARRAMGGRSIDRLQEWPDSKQYDHRRYRWRYSNCQLHCNWKIRFVKAKSQLTVLRTGNDDCRQQDYRKNKESAGRHQFVRSVAYCSQSS